MDNPNKTARIAGLLYLPVVVAGPFQLIYVPKKLFVPGDATATVHNILAHESLFRAHILTGLVSELFFLAAVLTLYRLLKEKGPALASVMALLILITAPMAFIGLANEVATLAFVKNPGILSVFDKPQRDALATLFISMDRHGALVAEMFWGLWLFPLGVLLFRSRFVPRFLGVWIVGNGLAYVVLSLTGLLLPEARGAVFKAATPLFMGEAVLMLWLVLAGARVPSGDAGAGSVTS